MRITKEYIQSEIARGKNYTVVFLTAGPNRSAYPAEKLEENHMAHLAYLFALKEEGKLLVNGPVTDNPNFLGMSIYASSDKEEVRALVEADPAVIAGRFSYEMYSYFSLPGSTLV